jgi:beta-galactosidase
VPVSGAWFNGISNLWAERLKVLDEANVQVLARFGESNGWLDGRPAVTVHSHGKGRVYFIGAYLDEASQEVLIDQITRAAGIQPAMQTPAGVEARKRTNASGEEIYIVINHARKTQPVSLPWSAREHLTGRTVNDLELEPYGVAVITRLN